MQHDVVKKKIGFFITKAKSTLHARGVIPACICTLEIALVKNSSVAEVAKASCAKYSCTEFR